MPHSYNIYTYILCLSVEFLRAIGLAISGSTRVKCNLDFDEVVSTTMIRLLDMVLANE